MNRKEIICCRYSKRLARHLFPQKVLTVVIDEDICDRQIIVVGNYNYATVPGLFLVRFC